jgi:hypothetical protein
MGAFFWSVSCIHINRAYVFTKNNFPSLRSRNIILVKGRKHPLELYLSIYLVYVDKFLKIVLRNTTILKIAASHISSAGAGF